MISCCCNYKSVVIFFFFFDHLQRHRNHSVVYQLFSVHCAIVHTIVYRTERKYVARVDIITKQVLFGV